MPYVFKACACPWFMEIWQPMIPKNHDGCVLNTSLNVQFVDWPHVLNDTKWPQACGPVQLPTKALQVEDIWNAQVKHSLSFFIGYTFSSGGRLGFENARCLGERVDALLARIAGLFNFMLSIPASLKLPLFLIWSHATAINASTILFAFLSFKLLVPATAQVQQCGCHSSWLHGSMGLDCFHGRCHSDRRLIYAAATQINELNRAGNLNNRMIVQHSQKHKPYQANTNQWAVCALHYQHLCSQRPNDKNLNHFTTQRQDV